MSNIFMEILSYLRILSYLKMFPFGPSMYDHRARSIFKLYIRVIVNGLLGYSINIEKLSQIKWIRTGRASVLYWNIHGQLATAGIPLLPNVMKGYFIIMPRYFE